jgi:RNA polymerase sigma-70 factor, ECF subfamily
MMMTLSARLPLLSAPRSSRKFEQPQANFVSDREEPPVEPSRSPATAETDAELVDLCRRGVMSAFEGLYRQHGARMKSVAYNLLGNRPDAEDAVQETFIKVYRSIGTFQSQSSFSTWLYRILVNTCRDFQRSRRRRTESPDIDLREQELRGFGHSGGANLPLRVALENALAQINPKHRTVFLLAEVEGFRHAEIADVLGIPEGTSKNWLFEAKRALQQALRAGSGSQQ